MNQHTLKLTYFLDIITTSLSLTGLPLTPLSLPPVLSLTSSQNTLRDCLVLLHRVHEAQCVSTTLYTWCPYKESLLQSFLDWGFWLFFQKVDFIWLRNVTAPIQLLLTLRSVELFTLYHIILCHVTKIIQHVIVNSHDKT